MCSSVEHTHTHDQPKTLSIIILVYSLEFPRFLGMIEWELNENPKFRIANHPIHGFMGGLTVINWRPFTLLTQAQPYCILKRPSSRLWGISSGFASFSLSAMVGSCTRDTEEGEVRHINMFLPKFQPTYSLEWLPIAGIKVCIPYVIWYLHTYAQKLRCLMRCYTILYSVWV